MSLQMLWDFAGEALSEISVIADNGVFYELNAGTAKSVSVAFTTIAGVKCGVVATSYAQNEGKIDTATAKKIARFVSLCDRFNLPVITLVDSLGLAIDAENESNFAPELAKLAYAYAGAKTPMITVIAGEAYGAIFSLMGYV